MATVRFSEDLKNEILTNAKNVFAARYVQAEEAIPEGFADRIYQAAFGPWVSQMEALPSWAFPQRTEFCFEGLVASANDRGTPAMFRDNIAYKHIFSSKTVKLSSSRPFPNEVTAEAHGLTCRFRHDFYIIEDDPRWTGVLAEFKEYLENIHTVYKEREEFVGGVAKIILSYSTLAPALKAWPALWDLVPEKAKHRHLTVKERNKRDMGAELGVDTNKLTAAVARTKLTGGL